MGASVLLRPVCTTIWLEAVTSVLCDGEVRNLQAEQLRESNLLLHIQGVPCSLKVV